MTAATLNITGQYTGMPDGGPFSLAPAQWQNGASPGPGGLFALGTNTVVNIPANKVGALITPPSGNGVQLTLKGVAGDTGVLLHLTFPTAVSLASGQTSFVLNAASAVSVTIDWI